MSGASYILGVDLGQSQDWTAFTVLEKSLPAGEEQYRYAVRHLERPRLGTLYPTIVARVKELLRTPPLDSSTQLVVDQTGVGAAVVDLLREAGLTLTAITITGGDLTYHEGSSTRVPKRDLVSTVSVLLQTGRLTIAQDLPLAQTLVKELLNFRMKIDPLSGHDSYSAWREADHDDLVLATALACWYGENGGCRYVPFADQGEARDMFADQGSVFESTLAQQLRSSNRWGFGR